MISRPSGAIVYSPRTRGAQRAGWDSSSPPDVAPMGQLLVERSRDDSVRYTWGVCSSSKAGTTLYDTLGAFARRAKPRRLCSIHLERLLVDRSRDDSVRYTWGDCSSSEAETRVHYIQLPTSTSLGEHSTSLGEHSTSLGEHSISLGVHSISLGVHTALI